MKRKRAKGSGLAGQAVYALEDMRAPGPPKTCRTKLPNLVCADYFVGHFASNLSRLAYLLAVRVCLPFAIPPFLPPPMHRSDPQRVDPFCSTTDG